MYSGTVKVLSRWQVLRVWHWLCPVPDLPDFTLAAILPCPSMRPAQSSCQLLPHGSQALYTFVSSLRGHCNLKWHCSWRGNRDRQRIFLSDCKSPLYYLRCLAMTSFSSWDTHWAVLLPDVLSSPLMFHGATQQNAYFWIFKSLLASGGTQF